MSRRQRDDDPFHRTGGETGTPAPAASLSSCYELRLYTTGATPLSARAISNVRRLCEAHLEGRYALEIVDIIQQPELLKEDQILAAPTLIKRRPLPPRRFIGDMSRTEVLLKGLDLPDIEGEP